MTATDHTVEINSLNLHYLEWGEAFRPVILLLHGFMGHAHVWDDLASALSPSYRVLALDQRGHGDSDWSADACYGMDQHFADLSVFIDSLQVKKLILLGHSMGGRNALFYTACRPEKVARLMLVDARITSGQEADPALQRQITTLPVRVRQIREVEVVLRRLYPHLTAGVCSHIAGHGYRKNNDGWLAPKFDMRMSRQLRKNGEPLMDLRQMIGNVTCPVLFVRGKESPFVTQREFNRLRSALPEATFEEVPDSTHMPAHENPEIFKKIVFSFLDHNGMDRDL